MNPVSTQLVAVRGEAPTAEIEHGGMVAMLCSDIEDSSGHIDRLGDVPWTHLLGRHNAIVRECLRHHDGAELKALGDGFIATFGSCRGAIEAALDIRRSFAAPSLEFNPPLRVRIGIHAGEPLLMEGDLFGAAITRLTRVTSCAKPGEILVTRVVADLVEGQRYAFHSLGARELRGFASPSELLLLNGVRPSVAQHDQQDAWLGRLILQAAPPHFETSAS